MTMRSRDADPLERPRPAIPVEATDFTAGNVEDDSARLTHDGERVGRRLLHEASSRLLLDLNHELLAVREDPRGSTRAVRPHEPVAPGQKRSLRLRDRKI